MRAAAKRTTAGNCCLDEAVELLVTTDGELKVTGVDTLGLEVLAGVAGKLEDLRKRLRAAGWGG